MPNFNYDVDYFPGGGFVNLAVNVKSTLGIDTMSVTVGPGETAKVRIIIPPGVGEYIIKINANSFNGFGTGDFRFRYSLANHNTISNYNLESWNVISPPFADVTFVSTTALSTAVLPGIPLLSATTTAEQYGYFIVINDSAHNNFVVESVETIIEPVSSQTYNNWAATFVNSASPASTDPTVDNANAISVTNFTDQEVADFVASQQTVTSVTKPKNLTVRKNNYAKLTYEIPTGVSLYSVGLVAKSPWNLDEQFNIKFTHSIDNHSSVGTYNAKSGSAGYTGVFVADNNSLISSPTTSNYTGYIIIENKSDTTDWILESEIINVGIPAPIVQETTTSSTGSTTSSTGGTTSNTGGTSGWTNSSSNPPSYYSGSLSGGPSLCYDPETGITSYPNGSWTTPDGMNHINVFGGGGSKYYDCIAKKSIGSSTSSSYTSDYTKILNLFPTEYFRSDSGGNLTSTILTKEILDDSTDATIIASDTLLWELLIPPGISKMGITLNLSEQLSVGNGWSSSSSTPKLYGAVMKPHADTPPSINEFNLVELPQENIIPDSKSGDYVGLVLVNLPGSSLIDIPEQFIDLSSLTGNTTGNTITEALKLYIAVKVPTSETVVSVLLRRTLYIEFSDLLLFNNFMSYNYNTFNAATPAPITSLIEYDLTDYFGWTDDYTTNDQIVLRNWKPYTIRSGTTVKFKLNLPLGVSSILLELTSLGEFTGTNNIPMLFDASFNDSNNINDFNLQELPPEFVIQNGINTPTSFIDTNYLQSVALDILNYGGTFNRFDLSTLPNAPQSTTTTQHTLYIVIQVPQGQFNWELHGSALVLVIGSNPLHSTSYNNWRRDRNNNIQILPYTSQPLSGVIVDHNLQFAKADFKNVISERNNYYTNIICQAGHQIHIAMPFPIGIHFLNLVIKLNAGESFAGVYGNISYIEYPTDLLLLDKTSNEINLIIGDTTEVANAVFDPAIDIDARGLVNGPTTSRTTEEYIAYITLQAPSSSSITFNLIEPVLYSFLSTQAEIDAYNVWRQV